MVAVCEHSSVEPSRPDDLVTSFLFNDDGAPIARIVAVCAEPGMGSDLLAASVVSRAVELGIRNVYRDYSSVTPAAASRSIVRLAKQLSYVSGPRIVGIFDIPPSDESCVARQARALRRMSDDGASVLFTIRPEARQLIEALPECRVVSASFLYRQRASGVGSKGVSHEALKMTRGIPCLVDALGQDTFETDRPEIPIGYYDALGNLLEQSLRPSLSDEERRLRLGIILLGRGRTSDLLDILGAHHSDLLADIQEHAPLFGLSTDLTHFNCLSAVVPNALVACVRNLVPFCALFPDVVTSCMKAVVEDGHLARAAALALFPECRDSLGIVIERAPEFVDVGEVRLVQHAAEVVEESDEGLAFLRSVVASLDTRGACVLPACPSSGGASEGLRLFGEARGVLWGKVPEVSAAAIPGGGLERRLAVHVSACSLMLRGSFSAALAMLMGAFETGRDPRISNALLAIDVELARLFTGGQSFSRDGGTSRSEEFILRHPLRGLSGYLAIHELVNALLRPGEKDGCEGLQEIVSRHECAGDALVRVVALLSGAVDDLRSGSIGRAQVRASLAEAASRDFSGSYLNRVSRLLVGVARYMLGDRPEPRVPNDINDDLEAITSLVWEVYLSEDDPMLASVSDGRVPWDSFWLLRELCTGMGTFSALLVERVPARWKRAMASATPTLPSPSLRPIERPPSRAASGGASRPVTLSLLGGFSLSIHGERIPNSRLERRNMKSLLEYLVLRGGCAKRYQIVEQVWPDCDYVLGFNRAYQATSALRSLVANVDGNLELIVANRASGEISVSMDIVSCDVNEFREVALEAVDSIDAAWSLECARTAERLYAGDLYLPQTDATGFIASMRGELRNLYADAMVEGSKAALELGHDRSAARLAENAVMANDMREDAVTALVRALQSCGRESEALRQRRAFEGRVAHATSRRA